MHPIFEDKIKKNKNSEDSLRDFWDTIKKTNLCVLGVSEGEEKKKTYSEK